jgi:hypothetical protein
MRLITLPLGILSLILFAIGINLIADIDPSESASRFNFINKAYAAIGFKFQPDVWYTSTSPVNTVEVTRGIPPTPVVYPVIPLIPVFNSGGGDSGH